MLNRTSCTHCIVYAWDNTTLETQRQNWLNQTCCCSHECVYLLSADFFCISLVLFSCQVYPLCCHIELVRQCCWLWNFTTMSAKKFCWYQMCAWSGLGNTRASAIQGYVYDHSVCKKASCPHIMKWCQVLHFCKVTKFYKSHYGAQQHHSRQWNTEAWGSKNVFWLFVQ